MPSSITLSGLRQLALAFCPDLESILMHDSDVTASTWHVGVETGKSVELVSLCGLVASLRQAGCTVTFPSLFKEKPNLFYIRNVIPRHYGAQAGHSAAVFDQIPLADRFVGALTPKAIVHRPDGKKYLIFREGNPFHLINWVASGRPEYLDRPDILIAEGSLHLQWIKDTILSFRFVGPVGICEGKLRVKNDINLPLVELSMSDLYDVPVSAIIECSVGKGEAAAEEQLARYIKLFSVPPSPMTVLINGKKKACPAYTFDIQIDISKGNDKQLSDQLSAGLDRFSSKFVSPL